MTNNLTLPATGAVVASDDVSGVHFQRFKLFSGEEDSAEPIGDTDLGSARAIWVDPRPSKFPQTQTSSGLTTATTAYVAGDVYGAGWTFTNMARASGGGGAIIGASLLDKADVIGVVELYLASASITFGTDNAPPSISDTDGEKLLKGGKIPLAYADDLGGCRFATTSGISVPYTCDATSLFVYAITRTGHTSFSATTDLMLTLHYVLD